MLVLIMKFQCEVTRARLLGSHRSEGGRVNLRAMGKMEQTGLCDRWDEAGSGE
jgi:hypothetical protein